MESEFMRNFRDLRDYGCWLNYDSLDTGSSPGPYRGQFQTISVYGDGLLTSTISEELRRGIGGLLGCEPRVFSSQGREANGASVKVIRKSEEGWNLGPEGYQITVQDYQG